MDRENRTILILVIKMVLHLVVLSSTVILFRIREKEGKHENRDYKSNARDYRFNK